VPLVLGGDHSIAVGFLFRGLKLFSRGSRKRVGYLWLDAHGRYETRRKVRPRATFTACRSRRSSATARRSWSNCSVISRRPSPRNVALVGVRDLDSKERRLIKEFRRPRFFYHARYR